MLMLTFQRGLQPAVRLHDVAYRLQRLLFRCVVRRRPLRCRQILRLLRDNYPLPFSCRRVCPEPVLVNDRFSQY